MTNMHLAIINGKQHPSKMSFFEMCSIRELNFFHPELRPKWTDKMFIVSLGNLVVFPSDKITMQRGRQQGQQAEQIHRQSGH
jgi:hypothetical protein